MGRSCYKPDYYSQSRQDRSFPPALWFPFAQDLMRRETEAVGQATERIWSARLADTQTKIWKP